MAMAMARARARATARAMATARDGRSDGRPDGVIEMCSPGKLKLFAGWLRKLAALDDWLAVLAALAVLASLAALAGYAQRNEGCRLIRVHPASV